AVVAAGRLLLQAFQADRFQVARQARFELPQRRRLAFEHLADRLDRAGRLERRAAGEQLVEGGAQGGDVGGRADRAVLAGGLLRRHVTGGAHDGTAGRLRRVVVHSLGQAEVGDLRDEGLRPVVAGAGLRPELVLAERERLPAAGAQEYVGRL